MRFRFAIRDLFWLTLVVALGLAWFMSWTLAHRRHLAELAAVTASVKNPPMEERIRQRLDSKIDKIDFVETPLSDVVSYLVDKYGIPIQFDLAALKEATPPIDPTTTPITRSASDIKLRSALKLLLEEHHLKSIIENEVLLITTEQRANSTLTMRIYDVNDLVPNKNEEAASKALDQLTETIASMPSWRLASGAGVAKPFRSNGVCTIAVSQISDVHEEIEKTLADMRKLRREKADAE